MQEGRASGGYAAYGLEYFNPSGSKYDWRYKHGDPKHVKTVRQIFTWYGRELKAMNRIANELNARKVPSPNGKLWYPATVKEILQRRAYRGDPTYNNKKSGQFHIVNSHRQVEAVHPYQDEERQPWKRTVEGLVIAPKAVKAIVDPDLFDTVQKRLASLSMRGSRARKEQPFPLQGILVCEHCGKFMYGCEPKGRHRAYRCSTRIKKECKLGGKPELHEDFILPHVLRMLGEVLENPEKYLYAIPEQVSNPTKHLREEREQLQRDRDNLRGTNGTGC